MNKKNILFNFDQFKYYYKFATEINPFIPEKNPKN